MKSRSLVFVAIAGLAGASVLSCASQSAATAAPAEQSAAPAAPATQPQAAEAPAAAAPIVGPPQVAWKDMTKEQRGKYMGMVVLPKMREVFRAFDGEKYAAIGCPACHGKDARDRAFKMPNPGIFVLPGTPEEFGVLAKEKPEWVKFMAEKVKPEMAALLGMKEYDPKNPQPDTLGCYNCHTVKGK